jgi:hypothetical protein
MVSVPETHRLHTYLQFTICSREECLTMAVTFADIAQGSQPKNSRLCLYAFKNVHNNPPRGGGFSVQNFVLNSKGSSELRALL